MPSLRRQLQSASLWAVVAGYSVLLLGNHWLSNEQRALAHKRLLDELALTLQSPLLSSAQLDERLSRLWFPRIQIYRKLGMPLDHAPGLASNTHQSSQRWLVSSLTISLRDARDVELIVRENVTDSVRQEWLSQMLLIAMAGISSLVTGVLLRPVIRQGLLRPLSEFVAELDSTQIPPSEESQLSLLNQPVELQPIVRSFNRLQLRLVDSWNRERTFVDGVSHELRTPITLISGYAQSLARASLPQSVLPSIQLIGAEAKRMGSLVSVLLDLARHDSGRFELCTSSLDPCGEILLAYERLQPTTNNRLRLFAAAQDLDLPAAFGNSERLQQCIAALVENALLYSPRDKPVALSLSSHPQFVCFHVIDEGAGVPEGERDLIFERFARGSAALDVRGSGIGLAMVKQLMEAMGGRVDVVDAPGGGADFRLHLPVSS